MTDRTPKSAVTPMLMKLVKMCPQKNATSIPRKEISQFQEVPLQWNSQKHPTRMITNHKVTALSIGPCLSIPVTKRRKLMPPNGRSACTWCVDHLLYSLFPPMRKEARSEQIHRLPSWRLTEKVSQTLREAVVARGRCSQLYLSAPKSEVRSAQGNLTFHK